MPPRHLVWLFLKAPEQLEKREQWTLSLLRRNKTIDHAYKLAQQFVAMVKERNARPMDAWLLDCQESEVSAPFDFCPGVGERKFCPSCSLNTSIQ